MSKKKKHSPRSQTKQITVLMVILVLVIAMIAVYDLKWRQNATTRDMTATDIAVQIPYALKTFMAGTEIAETQISATQILTTPEATP
ncbi:MAG: hypothetical protein H6670_01125 [Anaerolineaceae bacterium]|nr:hypothetical protein [Anaerolineaceae bacterium]